MSAWAWRWVRVWACECVRVWAYRCLDRGPGQREWMRAGVVAWRRMQEGQPAPLEQCFTMYEACRPSRELFALPRACALSRVSELQCNEREAS